MGRGAWGKRSVLSLLFCCPFSYVYPTILLLLAPCPLLLRLGFLLYDGVEDDLLLAADLDGLDLAEVLQLALV